MTDGTKQKYDYLRIRISGEILTRSLLHCGDGGDIPAEEWTSQKKFKEKKGRINSVCKGAEKDSNAGSRPYIPASTLRGSLRERCQNPDALFGTAHGKEGRMGKVRVYDAFLKKTAAGPSGDLYWNEQFETTLRDGVSIDPITNTAAEHLLFTHEVVPEGSIFELTLEADRLTAAELDSLLELLHGWNGGMESAIGKGRSKGWGRIYWNGVPEVKVLEDAAVKEWMERGTTALPPMKNIETSFKTLGRTGRNRTLSFSLHPGSPLLVNDPGRVRDKEKDDDHFPDLAFMRTQDGKALIPGSTLRGAVRAQARRILATIAHQHCGLAASEAGKAVDPLVEELFGTERRRSPLWIGDAVAQDTETHKQTFIAVDRFTGGVAKTALYSVEAAVCASLNGECAIEPQPHRAPGGDWWKGLLLLVIRDLMEGDLVVGWGKARGYGNVVVTLQSKDGERIENFAKLLQLLPSEINGCEPEHWLDALQKRVSDIVQQGINVT